MGIVVASVISLVTGLLAGLPFFIASGRQLRQAATSLQTESAKVRNMVKLITRAMEEAGIAEFTKDENGDPQGLVFNRVITDYLGISGNVGGWRRRPIGG